MAAAAAAAAAAANAALIVALQAQVAQAQQAAQAQQQAQVQQQAQIDQLLAAQAAAAAAPGGPHAAAAPAAAGIDAFAAHNAQLLAYMRLQAAGAGPTFTGKSVGMEARRWLVTLQRYFAAAGLLDDASRLLAIGTLLIGPAQTWWDSELARAAGDASRIATWAQFEAALKKRYEPVDALQWARAQMTALAASSSSMTVPAYTERYMEIMALSTDMAETDRIYNYKLSIPGPTRSSVAPRPHLTLQAVAEDALRTDANRVPSSSNSNSSSNRFAGRFSSTRPTGSSTSVNQMEEDEEAEQTPSSSGAAGSSDELTRTLLSIEARLNALSSNAGHSKGRGGRPNGGAGKGAAGTAPLNPGRTPGLPDELARERYNKGVCVRCGQSGHFKAGCTNTPKLN